MLTVLGDDGIDLLPGEEVVLGRDLHLIEDLKSAGGDHGVLLRQKRQRIQKGEPKGDDRKRKVAPLGHQAEQQQEDDQYPAADGDPLFPRLGRARNVDRGRNGFPGKRLSHGGSSFLKRGKACVRDARLM